MKIGMKLWAWLPWPSASDLNRVLSVSARHLNWFGMLLMRVQRWIHSKELDSLATFSGSTWSMVSIPAERVQLSAHVISRQAYLCTLVRQCRFVFTSYVGRMIATVCRLTLHLFQTPSCMGRVSSMFCFQLSLGSRITQDIWLQLSE